MVLMALSMVVLLGVVGLAIDGGNLYLQRRQMQNAADAGAYAGAYLMAQGNSKARLFWLPSPIMRRAMV